MAVTDSHFLHASLGDRVLGAYYLGCAMTERFKRSFGEQWGRDATATRPPVAKVRVVHIFLHFFFVVDVRCVTRRILNPTPRFRFLSFLHSDSRRALMQENLVVVDGDLAHYPPEHDVDVPAPDGARVVTAGGFSPEQMQLLLLRAKVGRGRSTVSG